MSQDGFVLAHLLAHPKFNLNALPAALRAFDAVRRPFAQMVAERSMQTARLTIMQAPPFADLTAAQSMTGTAVTMAQLKEMAALVEETMDWMKGTSVAEECADVVQRFEQTLS